MDRIDAALLVVRLLIGGTMIIHGLNHAFGGGKLPGAARWFESLGLRHGMMQAAMSALVEVAGGVGIATGFLTFLSSSALIGVMLVAGITAHRHNGYFSFKDGYEYVLFVAVTTAAVAISGPGRMSIDHAIGLDVSGWQGGLLAGGLAVVGVGILLGATYRPPAEVADD